ncbi:hypothetical protein ACOSP7_031073 [Xanthoceras sorbifolium]
MAVTISVSSTIEDIVIESPITDDVNQGIDGMRHNETIIETIVSLKKDSLDRDSLLGNTGKGKCEVIEISILRAVSMHDNKTPMQGKRAQRDCLGEGGPVIIVLLSPSVTGVLTNTLGSSSGFKTSKWKRSRRESGREQREVTPRGSQAGPMRRDRWVP